MRAIFAAGFFLISINLFAPGDKFIAIQAPANINPWFPLWYATCIIESENNPAKVNIREGAYGIVQIRQCKLDDYNKDTSNSYTISLVTDVSVSKKIFMHHCSSCKSFEEAARTWNGGPNGMDKPQTKFYWDRISKVLAKM
jgi:hypothetical protein